jgi:iron-sulfur cluster assembly protein
LEYGVKSVKIDITITPEAVQAYKKYAEFQEGEYYRLYVRTSGPGTGGLFYAVEKTQLDEVKEGDAVCKVEGIYFVIRPNDAWYFDGGTLSYNKYLGEYGFEFHNPNVQ